MKRSTASLPAFTVTIFIERRKPYARCKNNSAMAEGEFARYDIHRIRSFRVYAPVAQLLIAVILLLTMLPVALGKRFSVYIPIEFDLGDG
jgi:hypothetical protein